MNKNRTKQITDRTYESIYEIPIDSRHGMPPARVPENSFEHIYEELFHESDYETPFECIPEDRWERFRKAAIQVGKEAFFQTNVVGKTFLHYLNSRQKKELLSELDAFCQVDYEEKVAVLLSTSVEHQDLVVLNERHQVVKECILAYLVEPKKGSTEGAENEAVYSFKRLQAAGLLLTSVMPGCPLGKTVFYYYYEGSYESSQGSYGLWFLQYLIKHLDDLSEYGINRFNAFSILRENRVSFADSRLFFDTAIAIDTPDFSLDKLSKYAKRVSCNLTPAADAVPRLLNTLFLFQNAHDKTVLLQNMRNSFYPLVFNRQGKNLLHVLAEHGCEDEVIKYLKVFQINSPLVIYDDNRETLYTLCVRNNLQKIFLYLVTSHPEHMKGSTYWSHSLFTLAVVLGRREIANILWSRRNDWYDLPPTGETFLHYAVLERQEILIRRCLEWDLEGAIRVDVPNAEGYSALSVAIQQEDCSLITLLEKCPGATEAKRSDLMNAIQQGHEKVARELLNLKAPLDKGMYNCTALDYALVFKRETIAQWIVDAGGTRVFSDDTISKLRKERVGKSLDADGKPVNKLFHLYQEAKISVTSPYPAFLPRKWLLIGGLVAYFAFVALFAFTKMDITVFAVGAVVAAAGGMALWVFLPCTEEKVLRQKKEYEVMREYACDLSRGLHPRKQEDLIEGLSEAFQEIPRTSGCLNWGVPKTQRALLQSQVILLERCAKKKWLNPETEKRYTLSKERQRLSRL